MIIKRVEHFVYYVITITFPQIIKKFWPIPSPKSDAGTQTDFFRINKTIRINRIVQINRKVQINRIVQINKLVLGNNLNLGNKLVLLK